MAGAAASPSPSPAAAATSSDGGDQARRFVVGYALAPKKQQSFIQPSLLSLAASRGIDLVAIDPTLPLESQGPFDCILHKLYGEEWRAQLDAFAAAHPGVPIIDRPNAIDRLHNRISMLQVVSELDVAPGSTGNGGGDTFGIPRQIVVYNASDLTDSTFLGALGFPLIAKPLVADGSAKSHKMSLIFHQEGLRKLRPPLVLQEFVNHGGVIFKVYVVGDSVTCVTRPSLPDFSQERFGGYTDGSLSFSQISNLAAPASVQQFREPVRLSEAEMPPEGFVIDIARALRHALGLRLFNFDMIRDVRVGNRYLIIDINYFPGYAKMPAYEPVVTNFLWDLVHGGT